MATRIMNNPKKISGHQKKLGHRGDVQHLRVHRDQDARSRTERAESQEAQLWRAIDDHDIVCFRNGLDGCRNAREENLLARPSLASEHPRRFVFEFLEFEVSRHDVEAREVGWLCHLPQRSPSVIIPKGAVEGFVFSYVSFWLIPEQCRQAGLGIQVDREYRNPRSAKYCDR